MNNSPIPATPAVTDDTPEQHHSMSKYLGMSKEQTCGKKEETNPWHNLRWAFVTKPLYALPENMGLLEPEAHTTATHSC